MRPDRAKRLFRLSEGEMPPQFGLHPTKQPMIFAKIYATVRNIDDDILRNTRISLDPHLRGVTGYERVQDSVGVLESYSHQSYANPYIRQWYN